MTENDKTPAETAHPLGLDHFMPYQAAATPEGYRATAGKAVDGGSKADLVAVIDALKTVHDPEIPVNIYDLGLIYDVDLKDNADIFITMSLTAPDALLRGRCPDRLLRLLPVLQVSGLSMLILSGNRAGQKTR